MKQIAILVVTLLLCGAAAAQTPGTATVGDSQIFTVVEHNPEFGDGMDGLVQWLGTHVEYPKEAKEKKLEGTVYVTFVVEKDGSISNVRILNHRENMTMLEEEALRVMQMMPKWKPGKTRGKKVRVQFTLPIVFQL